MIQSLWRRHYYHGATGSFHGDMAQAFRAMLDDPDCDRKSRNQIEYSIRLHVSIGQRTDRLGILGDQRKWFSEMFGRHTTETSAIR